MSYCIYDCFFNQRTEYLLPAMMLVVDFAPDCPFLMLRLHCRLPARGEEKKSNVINFNFLVFKLKVNRKLC